MEKSNKLIEADHEITKGFGIRVRIDHPPLLPLSDRSRDEVDRSQKERSHSVFDLGVVELCKEGEGEAPDLGTLLKLGAQAFEQVFKRLLRIPSTFLENTLDAIQHLLTDRLKALEKKFALAPEMMIKEGFADPRPFCQRLCRCSSISPFPEKLNRGFYDLAVPLGAGKAFLS